MDSISAFSFLTIAPEIILVVGALLVLTLDMAAPRDPRGLPGIFGIATLVVAAYYSTFLWNRPGFYFSDTIVIDNFRIATTVILLLGAAFTLLMSGPYLRREGIDHGEYYALVLFATLGMTLMTAAMDLIVLFLGLETLSVALYILAALHRTNVRSNEAGMKYLLTGSFATAFLLYGIALVYGATGYTNLDDITRVVIDNVGKMIAPAQAVSGLPLPSEPTADGMLLAGIALLLVGFGFKIAAFPFHAWAPDVYQGAPTSVTAFMAAGTKVAAFAALTRVFFTALGPVQPSWAPAVAWIAVLTMTLGNFVAVTQTDLKRLIAYSSIAHAGYLLVGIASGTAEASSAIVFYLAVYTLMTMGVFAIFIYLGRKGEANLNLYDFAGLGFRFPLLGAAMVVMMASLAGIPPTAGFVAKFVLFRAAVESGLTWLVVIAVLNSVVSIYYYFGVVVSMFMHSPEEEPASLAHQIPVAVTVAVATVATLILGIVPQILLDTTGGALLTPLGLR